MAAAVVTRPMRLVGLTRSAVARLTVARVRAFAPMALLALTACITHLPPRTTAHKQIAWQPSFDAAAQASAATGKPLLAVLAAGERDGLC